LSEIIAGPTSGEQATAPRFIQKLQPKRAQDGTTLQFECQVEGKPRPQITWFKETAIILPSQDFQVSFESERLISSFVQLFPLFFYSFIPVCIIYTDSYTKSFHVPRY
jgi:hypothetical protein